MRFPECGAGYASHERGGAREAGGGVARLEKRRETAIG